MSFRAASSLRDALTGSRSRRRMRPFVVFIMLFIIAADEASGKQRSTTAACVAESSEFRSSDGGEAVQSMTMTRAHPLLIVAVWTLLASAGAAQDKRPIVTMETSHGTIKLELYADKAPAT